MRRLILLFIFVFSAIVSIAQTRFDVNGLIYEILSESDRTVELHDGSNSSGEVSIPSVVSYNGNNYSVTTVSDKAFFGCDGLTSVTIPNSVTAIGNGAFVLCEQLTSVTISNSVTAIGDEAFYHCYGLISINVDSGNSCYKSIDGVLFNFDATTLIQCPEGNSRTNYVIPNSVTTIGNEAFSGCVKLTSVSIPNSVKSIGSRAFWTCSGLTMINVDSENKYYKSIDGVLFNFDATTLIQCPEGNSRTNYVIPNSVTAIGSYAFYECSGLASITIPNSVITIGSAAFANCHGLTSVTIPNSVTAIGEEAFRTCSGLTSVSIPNSVITIGSAAFSGCYELTSVTIPNSVTTIGFAAFSGCDELTSVTIPNSVTTIGYAAFYDCSGLTSVTIPNSVTTIGEKAFSGCVELISVTIPNSVTTIDINAFAGCSRLKEVINYAKEPQQVSETIFSSVNLGNVRLSVPSLSLDKYKNADVWSGFGEFKGM